MAKAKTAKKAKPAKQITNATPDYDYQTIKVEQRPDGITFVIL